ncbi:TMhelix containing protein [Vibrio phage 1.186.O._10N.286.49.E3]|nr:TMhelix containing protein [Vibrio phage 1.186.O._10N.286.49.E3]
MARIDSSSISCIAWFISSISARVYVPLFISFMVHNGGHTPSIPTVGLIKYQSMALFSSSVLKVARLFLLEAAKKN